MGTPEEAWETLAPYPDDLMVAWPVSTRVNKPQNKIRGSLAGCGVSGKVTSWNRLMTKQRASRSERASFIETMDCLPVTKVPTGPAGTYEIKLDGYRLEAIKSRGKVTVYSRRRNVLNEKFGYIAEALADLPTRRCSTAS